MNKIQIFLLALAFVCVSCVSSQVTPTFNLYSVQTNMMNHKELLVIDPFNYKVLYNISLQHLQSDVIQILSLDTTTGELLLLCSNSNNQILVSVSTSSPTASNLAEVEIGNNFNYALQSYIWLEDLKTATLPAQVSVNGTYSNFIMATEFGNSDVVLYNLTHLVFAPYTIQGYDYINDIYYISYLNMNGSFHIMSFDFNNPSETAKYYYDISNIVMTDMVFTDLNGNVYFLNQQYKNSTQPSGYYDICRVTLGDQPSCGPALYTVYLGDQESYTYIPYIQSQDSSTILFIVNQAPGVLGFTETILLTYVQLNGDSVTATNVTIPNDDQSGNIFQSKVYAF
ncbi:hypothetical protein RB653_006604 [Dictyostelium firmibasis]|uniref:Uncharacterized protein n=1 Tax=Dictyostelium firmibasis TaxID=79012 RepID=A0AAN7TT88_9MYCE